MNSTVRQIAIDCGGRLAGDGDRAVKSIYNDTRKPEKGGVYLAIVGPVHNGNLFCGAAAEQGCVAVIVGEGSEIEFPEGYEDTPVIYVRDPRQAYLDIARANRKRQNGLKVIAITGSAGKTTTKEMIAKIVSAKYKTVKTEGNLNNAVGLPYIVCRIDETTEAAVIEMGMSGKGEIDVLASVITPDICVITNIGQAHIERLGSRHNIFLAKLEVADHMAPGSVLVLNGDDTELNSDECRKMLEERGIRPVYFGINKNGVNSYRAENIEYVGDNGEMTGRYDLITPDGRAEVKLFSASNPIVYDSLAAVAAAVEAGVPLDEAVKSLEDYTLPPMRLQKIAVDGVTVIVDCYNSNPQSAQAAVEELRKTKAAGRRIAVIGDMLELGTFTEQSHRVLGSYIAHNDIDILYTIGDGSRFAADAARNAGMKEVYEFGSEDKSGLAVSLNRTLMPGDVVLFKASRGMRFENIVNDTFRRNIV